MDVEELTPGGDAVEPATGASESGAAEPASLDPAAPDEAPDEASAATKPGPPASADQTELAISPEPTGVPSVDAALDRLRDLESVPVDEHIEIFDDVQRQLHDALAELDDEQ